MPTGSADSLPAARAKLMALASASRPPRILDVLRTLRAELLQCVKCGHSGSAVLAALRAAGFVYSRSAFSEAWKTFRDENGLTMPRTVIYVPRGTVSRSTPAAPPTAAAPAAPSRIPAAALRRPGSALEELARPTISQLLAQNKS